MSDFKRLVVWQRAHGLLKPIYAATATFPVTERYVLVSQIHRATLSISGNIAEGCGRRTIPDEMRFYQIANGSAHELESHILAAGLLGFISAARSEQLLAEIRTIQRMLAGLLRRRGQGGANAVPRPGTWNLELGPQ